MDRNPKQDGSNVFSCRVQTGMCPIRCNQCFYNRDNGSAFYCDINQPHVPNPEELPEGAIVRMNDGHDSFFQMQEVLEQAAKYKEVFYNTSSLKGVRELPGPIVFTINPDETVGGCLPDAFEQDELDKIMFVRIRACPMSLHLHLKDAKAWSERGIPVVLTFMAYYDEEFIQGHEHLYTHRQRHINSYWCLNKEPMRVMLEAMKVVSEAPGFITTCGTIESNWCKDCGNCEKFYWLWKEDEL